MIKFRLTKNT